MTDETLQRLLRLKQHEHPQDMESFTTDLLFKLHQRQRAELLKQSSVKLFLERVRAVFDSLTAPQVALATASVLALLTGIVLMVDASSGNGGNLVVKIHSPQKQDSRGNHDQLARPMDLVMSPGFGVDRDLTAEGQRMSPLLLSKHFIGGYADEAADPWASESILNRPSGPIEMLPFMKFDDEPAGK